MVILLTYDRNEIRRTGSFEVYVANRFWHMNSERFAAIQWTKSKLQTKRAFVIVVVFLFFF